MAAAAREMRCAALLSAAAHAMLGHRPFHLAARVIEQAMVFALGFLVAGLLTLLFLPAFWRRAVRLSRRRLEMLMPLSMDEIIAERDQLRAQFAAERRRIEQAQETLQAARARDMAELGRRAAALAQVEAQAEIRERTLKLALDEAHARVARLEQALAGAPPQGDLTQGDPRKDDPTQAARMARTARAQDAALRRAIAAVGDDVARLMERLGAAPLGAPSAGAVEELAGSGVARPEAAQSSAPSAAPAAALAPQQEGRPAPGAAGGPLRLPGPAAPPARIAAGR